MPRKKTEAQQPIAFGDYLKSAKLEVKEGRQVLSLAFSRSGRPEDTVFELTGQPQDKTFDVNFNDFVGQTVESFTRTKTEEVVRFVGGNELWRFL